MGKYKTLGENSLYTFIGQIGSKVISLLMLPFYTRWLSVGDYGITDIITVYASLIMCIATLSMHEAIFVFPVNQSFERQKKYFSTAFASSLFSIAIVYFIFLLLYYGNKYIDVKNAFLDNLWFVATLFSTSYMQTFSQQFCRSINKMRVFCISGLLVTGLAAVFSFLCIPEYGVYGYILSYALANMIGFLYSFFVASEYKYVNTKDIDFGCFREMAKFAMPLIPNATLWWIISALNRPFMESSLGLGAIGLFAVANKFPGVVSMVLAIFSNSWQLSVLQEYGKENFDLFFNMISKFYIPIVILASGLLSLFCEQIFIWFVDDSFYSGWVYAPVMAIAVVGMSASGFYGSVFSAVKQSKYYLYSSVIGGIVTIVLNMVLIPLLGIWGAVLSFVMSHFAICGMRILYSFRFVNIHNLSVFVAFLLLDILLAIFVINGYTQFSYGCFVLMVIGFLFINKTSFVQVFTFMRNRKR